MNNFSMIGEEIPDFQSCFETHSSAEKCEEPLDEKHFWLDFVKFEFFSHIFVFLLKELIKGSTVVGYVVGFEGE